MFHDSASPRAAVEHSVAHTVCVSPANKAVSKILISNSRSMFYLRGSAQNVLFI